jgi:hypothetical protein
MILRESATRRKQAQAEEDPKDCTTVKRKPSHREKQGDKYLRGNDLIARILGGF